MGYLVQGGAPPDASVSTAKVVDDAITGAKIADDAIDSEHYVDGSIDPAHLADDAVSLAKMAAGTDGNIISYDASGNPVAIATGNDGQVLTSAGAGAQPAFEDVSGGSMVFISSATASNDATLSFTGISSTYDRYVFAIEAIRPATDGARLYLLTSTDNGSSYDTGASDYASVVRYSNVGIVRTDVNDNDAFLRVGPPTGNATTESVNGIMDLWAPSNSAMFTQITSSGTYSHTDGNPKSFEGGGGRKSAGDVDAVQFKMDSGNITSGTIRMYGIAKS